MTGLGGGKKLKIIDIIAYQDQNLQNIVYVIILHFLSLSLRALYWIVNYMIKKLCITQLLELEPYDWIS